MAASALVVRNGIEPILGQAGVDLEDVQIQTAGRREVVRVVVDRDGGVDLDLIAELSRMIAEALDARPLADEFDGTYVLEVTSPGVDRPLTEPRHWRRAVHRLVEATLRDGTVVHGRITEADASGVSIDGRVIAFADLSRGLVQVEFSRAGTPDDGPAAEAVDEDDREEA